MELFDGLDLPPQDQRYILDPVERVLSKLLALPAPRSLCELNLDGDDYFWLCLWANCLEVGAVRRWLNAYSQRFTFDKNSSAPISYKLTEGFGCLLLFVAAESARRNAIEGNVWPAVRDLFRPEVRDVLFVQGHPTQECKSALEAAARCFKLRHVFGIEGTQNYYVTIYLQFGFTRRGMNRLYQWLEGFAQTESIGHLLGQRMGSQSFTDLWSSLLNFRHNNITEQRLRQVLARSPWVLPEWADELVRRAREHPASVGPSTETPADLRSDEPSDFFEPPRLQWDGQDQPCFVCRFANLAAFDLSEAHYDVYAGGTLLARLLRKTNGDYALQDGSEGFVLTAVSGQQPVVLADPDGTVVVSSTVDLWDPAEEITVYESRSGRRIGDPWGDTLSPQLSYALLVSADLMIEPNGWVRQWQVLGNEHDQRRLWQLPAGAWPLDLRVTLEGQTFWVPNLTSHPRPRATEPGWAAEIQVTVESNAPIRLGQPVRPLVIGVPPSVDVTFIRCEGQPLNFTREAGRIRADSVVMPPWLTPGAAQHGMEVRIGVRRDELQSAQLRRQLTVPVRGIAQATTTGWAALSSDAMLTVDEANSSVFRLFLPSAWFNTPEQAEPALMEGTTYSARLPHQPVLRPRRLGRLAGFGAPLLLQRYPYNITEPPFRLVASVTAPGIVRSLETGDDRSLLVRLRTPTEPGADYQAVVWPLDSLPELVPGDRITTLAPDLWRLEGINADPEHILVGLAYRGERQGAWWPPALGTAWDEIAAGFVPPHEAAALARWLHLPLLRDDCLPVIRRWADDHAAATLAAWLLDQGLPSRLRFTSAYGEEWWSAVRRVFWGCQPGAIQTYAIVAALSDGSDEPLAAVASALNSDPLLLRQVLRQWPQDVQPFPGVTSLKAAMRMLRCTMTGLDPDARDDALGNREEELLKQAASDTQRDDAFLRNIVNRALAVASVSELEGDPVAVQNLRVALGIAPFRTYLTLRVLSMIG